jgi:predicted DNA-binding protein with PD1-like motif
MRRIVQPGPPAPARIQWVEASGRAFVMKLEAGLPLLEAARRGFASRGFAGGTLNIDAGALGPFAYVMPALSKTSDNAAFYSETFRPLGVTRLKVARMTLGRRGGAAFFHCHGLWTEADGRISGGHILPEATMVAESFEAAAFGLDGAIFTTEADPETNFNLFGPLTSPTTAGAIAGRAFALRLRPNQDLAGALEDFCQARGIARARVHGGVGSTIGARFADGRVVEPFATEVAVVMGAIEQGAREAPEATLDIALVDYTGGVAEGRLRRGDNPVLMTMELVLEVVV